MSLENYNKLVKKFINDYGAPHNKSNFIPTIDWYESCVNNHKEFSEIFLDGKDNKTFKIALDNGSSPISIEKARELYISLQELIPDYINHQKLLNNMSIEPMSFLYHNMPATDHKWIDSIKKYLNSKYSSKLEHPISKTVLDIMSKACEKWKFCENKTETINVTFSVSPMAFAKIGHYDCDDVSCFKQGGLNNSHKYYLGLHKNSFIILMDKNEKEKIICRSWGISNDSRNIINVCNYYPGKGESEANLRSAIKLSVANLMNTAISDLIVFDRKVNIEGIYHNNRDGDHPINWSFVKTDESEKFKEQKFSISISGMKMLAACCNCASLEANKTVDKAIFCDGCYEKLPVCYISNNKCRQTYDIYIDGEDRKVSALGMISITTCDYLGKRILTKDAIKIVKNTYGDILYCHKDHLKDFGYQICKKCNRVTKLTEKTCTFCETAKELEKRRTEERLLAKKKIAEYSYEVKASTVYNSFSWYGD